MRLIAMPSSASLRKQIETDFQHRYPSILTPSHKTIREVVPTGITQIDSILNGGLHVGAITELTGPISSGRTTMALSFLSQQTRIGNYCAWVDAADTLDPESAAANGIDLKKLLWVRCNKGSASVVPKSTRNANSQPWDRLDQALRATDLLLQSGGFTAIVLDMGSENIEYGRRIPLATWFRFRQAADRTRCSLIVLGKAPYAQSSAAVVLECQPSCINTALKTVIRDFSFRLGCRRERFSPLTSIDRCPPASTWSTQASWSAEKRA